MDALRNLYVILELKDRLTGQLNQINRTVDEFKNKVNTSTRPIKQMHSNLNNMTASLEQSFAQSRALFSQLDRIEREVIIRSRIKNRLLQEAAVKFDALRSRAREYGSVLASKLREVNTVIEKHRFALLGVGMALSGVIGLSVRGAINEEKYRRNIESLSSVIDYNREGWEKINKALQDYITSAEKVSYISKENRARLVSEMITMGAAKDTILKYGPTLEKLGVSLGKSTDEVITAIRGSLAGFHMAFKRLGVILREEDIKKKMEEIRDAHKGWSEEALRAEAIMELAYPQMVARIGDFDKAMNSSYGDIVKFKEKLSDLTGDIGAIYIPYLRIAVQAMTDFVNAIRSNPILEAAFAVGTLTLAVGTLGAVAIPKLIGVLKVWKKLTIGETIAKSRLAAAITSRLIPATVAEAYAAGGLTAALRAAAASFEGFAVAILTNPITWAILGIVGAILVLQDVLVKGWEKSYLGQFVAWLLEKLPFLKPVAEGVATAFNYLRSGIEWLSKSVHGLITWIQNALDMLGPLKYLLLGPIGPLILLVQNFDRVISAVRGFITWVHQGIDRLGPFKYALLGPVGAILFLAQNFDKVTSAIKNFITWIQNAWKAITENPIFKIFETIGGFVKLPSTVHEVVTRKKTINLIELTSQPSQTYIKHETKHINVPKIEIRINGAKDPEKVAEVVMSKLQRQFNAMGVY